jgi:hypothetical protein
MTAAEALLAVAALGFALSVVTGKRPLLGWSAAIGILALVAMLFADEDEEPRHHGWE